MIKITTEQHIEALVAYTISRDLEIQGANNGTDNVQALSDYFNYGHTYGIRQLLRKDTETCIPLSMPEELVISLLDYAWKLGIHFQINNIDISVEVNIRKGPPDYLDEDLLCTYYHYAHIKDFAGDNFFEDVKINTLTYSSNGVSLSKNGAHLYIPFSRLKTISYNDYDLNELAESDIKEEISSKFGEYGNA